MGFLKTNFHLSLSWKACKSGNIIGLPRTNFRLSWRLECIFRSQYAFPEITRWFTLVKVRLTFLIKLGIKPLMHNGKNDSQKRQFLALGVCSQSWKLNKLSKKNSCQIDWCYMLLATIWQKMFLLSNVDCKVSNLWNKIADKRGQLALISKCQFVSVNII